MNTSGKRVLLIDWLGQGGIFQTSLAWQRVLEGQGNEVVVLTRRGGEDGGDILVGSRFGKVVSHDRVARAAAAFIRERQPDMVIVQNYIIPPLEGPVYRAARDCGIRLVAVVHDHRPHSRLSGMQVTLKQLLQQADSVIVHSAFVGAGVEQFTGRRDIVQLPLPVPLAMLDLAPTAHGDTNGDVRTAVHFGVLKRQYKGMSDVLELAALRPPGWRFVVMGVGAPVHAANVTTVPGFTPTDQLVATIQAADACLLPYRWATQSAAVILAQALGTVPVATAVGGIPEQIEDGSTGFLVPPGASVDSWQRILGELSDHDRLRAVSTLTQQRIWERHRQFEADVGTLLAG